MKLVTKLFCILLALLFCFTACSDSSDQTNDDEQPKITLKADTFSAMHLSVSDAATYNDKAILRQHNSERFTDPNAEQIKTVAWLERKTTVSYKETYYGLYGNLHSNYESEDGNLKIVNFDKSNEIEQITAPHGYFALPDDLTTEEDYLTWIKELLESYGITDLSAYEYSCKTGLTEFGDNWAGGASRDYFYKDIDPTCEKLTGYEFRYTRIIDGYVTSDYIEIYISFATDMIMLRFDQGQFTNVGKIQLNEAKIQETLDEYVNACVNTEKYELISYTVQNRTLTYVDQKLCMVCSVALELDPLQIAEVGSISTLETIGVFCE